MRLLTIAFLFAFTSTSYSQRTLQPEFDPQEYGELLSLAFNSSSIADSVARLTAKDRYHMEYRSKEIGLKNRWTLYLRNDNVAVVDIRGTVADKTSWMANFYAAMVPATGSLQINDSTEFKYKLAEDPKASVHVGWTVSLAHLAPEIVAKLNEYYRMKQVKEVLIMGHSQGGAIAFLVRSYLEYAKQQNLIPADLFFKTYCSAAPKPGNMYYVYDYDFITRGGWGFNVVNSADWVPESPFTVQRLSNFNPTNIFVNVKPILRKQKFFVRLGANYLFSKMEKKPRKAQKRFEKYLGHKIYKMAIRKDLPELKEPAYVKDNNYMRAGTPIILMADSTYRSHYPENPEQPFTHHMFKAYHFLLLHHYHFAFTGEAE